MKKIHEALDALKRVTGVDPAEAKREVVDIERMAKDLVKWSWTSEMEDDPDVREHGRLLESIAKDAP